MATLGTYQLISYSSSGETVSSPTITVSNGTFVFSYATIANASSILSINSTTVGTSDDIHKNIRIENLFYQSAIIYILVFLVLYMIFIPLCTFYDMCKDKKSKRYKPYVIK